MNQELVNEAIKFAFKNNKLLRFVRNLADESVYERYENLNEVSWEATELLKEVEDL